MKTVRLSITGRVQGVSYRAWTLRAAREKGLKGWVRNRLDGSVEALLSGPPDQVDALVAQCHKGPPAARVDGVAVFEAGGESVPDDFTQAPTV